MSKITVFRENPHARVINQTVDVLERGGIIIYPTDTTYGIGADINNKKAIEKILHIKRETKFKALSFICWDFAHLTDYVKISNFAFKIMKRCLPGPYTFILDAKKLVPKLMLSKQKTAGIRLPDDEFCKKVIEKLGHPIVSTSIPEIDGINMNNPEEFYGYFSNQVDLIIDAGFIESEPSTVVSLTGDELEILREGKGDLEKLY